MRNTAMEPRRLMKIAWISAVLIPALAVIVTAIWLARTLQAAPAPLPPEVVSLENVQRGLTWVAKTIKPSVVFIEVERKVEEAARETDDSSVPDLRDFFGPNFPLPMPMPRQGPQQPTPDIPPTGQGSGVIIDPAGYIVTNNHVVTDAATVTVRLENGESYPAEIVGTDDITDLAVVKIQPKQSLKPAVLGDVDETEVGSWAVAVGYPFGGGRYGGAFDEPLHYEPTITVGVISALNRQIPSEREGHPFRGLVQTDAPINPGNSGGPLVNIRAQVIGINQAIYTNSPWGGGNIGVGFAIPINAKTREILETLKGGEKVVRGRLGISVEPLTEAKKQVYGLDHGVLVVEVEEGSAADQAGFKSQDIILELQGEKVSAQDEFVNRVQATKPGSEVDILVLRDEKRIHLKATLEALTVSEEEKTVAAAKPEKLGLTTEALPEETARKAKLTGGVRVQSVKPLSDGARAGFRAGDIIFKINREEVTDLKSYRRIVGELKKGDPAVVWISRAGRIRVLEIASLSE